MFKIMGGNEMNGKVIKEAYTFDDLLLVPAKSEVVPANVDTSTRREFDTSFKI